MWGQLTEWGRGRKRWHWNGGEAGVCRLRRLPARETGRAVPRAKRRRSAEGRSVSDTHSALRQGPPTPRLHPVLQRCRGLPKALPPQSEGASRGRQAERFPARSAVGVRRVGASATPTPLCDKARQPRGCIRFYSGVAAFRRPCHRSPKALRAGDRPRRFPARSAVGVRRVGASATPTPLCDEARPNPVATSGFERPYGLAQGSCRVSRGGEGAIGPLYVG